jgi:hypothetical protein
MGVGYFEPAKTGKQATLQEITERTEEWKNGRFEGGKVGKSVAAQLSSLFPSNLPSFLLRSQPIRFEQKHAKKTKEPLSLLHWRPSVEKPSAPVLGDAARG